MSHYPTVIVSSRIRCLTIAGVSGPSRSRSVVVIRLDSRDINIRTLLQAVPEERLRSSISKYFPSAATADLMPAVGGLSGDPVCWVMVNEFGSPFFLKFVRSSSDYLAEIKNHVEAKKWLGPAVVDLHLIPDLDYAVDQGLQAFPSVKNSSLFPICYESASNSRSPREPFRRIYGSMTDDFVARATRRLLTVLTADGPKQFDSEMPWIAAGGRGFAPESERVREFLETLNDLGAYGPAFCDDWDGRQKQLLSFPYNPWPAWMKKPIPAAIGHTHGDPNATNYFVSPADPQDLHLIDCAKYRPQGWMVSDLALIEADIKFSLLGTDRPAAEWLKPGRLREWVRRVCPGFASTAGFLDLDCKRLWTWCRCEQESVNTLLNYSPQQATTIHDATTRRAYVLVAQIRARARELAAPEDQQGAHYFTALIFWSIKFLELRHIRPTKKLLALYSISEILTRLSNPS